jgi:hypothetical protein
MPPSELLIRFSESELAELAAYMRIQPFGNYGLHLMFSHIMSMLWNTQFGIKKLKSFKAFLLGSKAQIQKGPAPNSGWEQALARAGKIAQSRKAERREARRRRREEAKANV